MPNIAVLLTCFNRKDKTIACLKSLLLTIENYNHNATDKLNLSIFLTDDACTDGTAKAAKEICQEEDIHIIKGNGNLYWAGGMRMAWNEALKHKQTWNFFLLLNDDTTLPVVIINDGRILEKNLRACGKDLNWLQKTLAEEKISSSHQVFLFTLDEQDNTYCVEKELPS
jgi:GT2 family glycosyltransferase